MASWRGNSQLESLWNTSCAIQAGRCMDWWQTSVVICIGNSDHFHLSNEIQCLSYGHSEVQVSGKTELDTFIKALLGTSSTLINWILRDWSAPFKEMSCLSYQDVWQWYVPRKKNLLWFGLFRWQKESLFLNWKLGLPVKKCIWLCFGYVIESKNSTHPSSQVHMFNLWTVNPAFWHSNLVKFKERRRLR